MTDSEYLKIKELQAKGYRIEEQNMGREKFVIRTSKKVGGYAISRGADALEAWRGAIDVIREIKAMG